VQPVLFLLLILFQVCLVVFFPTLFSLKKKQNNLCTGIAVQLQKYQNKIKLAAGQRDLRFILMI